MYIDNYGRIIHADASEGMKYGVPQLNKFPLPDARHVKSAIKFFNYVPPKYEKQLASAIIRRMKEYGLSFDDFTVGEENRFKKYVPDTYLAHHGILGQKWGKKNGPPYPLGASDHSAAEKKAGWRKSLASGAGNAIKATGRGIKRAGSWTADKIKMSKRYPNRLLNDADLERKINRYARENEAKRAMGKKTEDQKYAEKAEAKKYRREMAKMIVGETVKAIGSQAIANYIKTKLQNQADLSANRAKKDLDFEANVRGDIYRDARDAGFSAKAAESLAKGGKEFLRTEDPYRGLDKDIKKKAQERAFNEATKAGKSMDETLKIVREGGAKGGLHKQYDKPLEIPLPPKKDNNQYDKPIEIPLPPKQSSKPRLSDLVTPGALSPKATSYKTGPEASDTFNATKRYKLSTSDMFKLVSDKPLTGAAKKTHAYKIFKDAKMAALESAGTGAHVSGNYVVYADGSRKSLKDIFESDIDFWMGMK